MSGRVRVWIRLHHLDFRLAIVVGMIYPGGRWRVVSQLWLGRVDATGWRSL